MKRVHHIALRASVTTVALILIARSVDLDRVWDRIAAFPVAFVPAIGALLLVTLTISALKWRAILKTLGQPVAFAQLVRLIWVGLFFNTFLPGRTGGDAIRALSLPRCNGSRSPAVISVVIDRALNLLALVLIAAAATFLDDRIPADMSRGVRILAGLTTAGCAAFYAFRHTLFRVLPGVVSRKLRPLLSTRWQAADAVWVVTLAIAYQATMVLINFTAARAIGTPLSVAALFVAIPVTALITAIPVSINGFGLREAAYATLLSSLGATPESAVALSISVTAAIVLWSLVGGIVYAVGSRAESSRSVVEVFTGALSARGVGR